MVTPELQTPLREWLKKHVIFSILDDDAVSRLVEEFELAHFGLGENVIQEGEQGDCAYLLHTGKVRVLKRGPDGKPITLATLGPGDLFGELAILRNDVRTATVRASEDVTLFRLRREAFEKLLQAKPELVPYFDKFVSQRQLINFLRLKTFLGVLPVKEVIGVLDKLQEHAYPAGVMVVREGDAAERLFIVKSGQVRAAGDREGMRNLARLHGEGDYFGERALLLNAARAASVETVKDTVCLSLDKDTLTALMAKHPPVREQFARRLEQYRLAEELEAQFGLKPAAAPAPPPAAAEPAPAAPEANGKPPPQKLRIPPKWVRSYPWVPQHDSTDCGAASLAMVSRYYGIRLSVGQLREKAYVGREGAKLYNLAAAAEAIGYNCRAVKADYAALRGAHLPAIAFWKGYHYVVVYEVRPDLVILGDPARGIRKMPRAEFERGWTGHLLLLTPTPRLEQNEPERTTLTRFLPFLDPVKGLIGEVLVASLALQVLQLAGPVTTQLVVDQVLIHQNAGILNVLLAGLLLLGCFQIATTFLRQYLLLHVWEKLSLSLAADLFRQIFLLPMRHFHTRKLGDYLARFEDGNKVREMLTGRAITTVLDVLTLVSGTALMFYYNVRLALVAMVVLPLYAGMTFVFTPWLKLNNRLTAERKAQADSVLVEAIKAVSAVKEASAELPTRWRYEDLLVQQSGMEFQGRWLNMVLEGASRGVSVLGNVALLGYGAYLVIGQELTLGQYMAFAGLVNLTAVPMLNLVTLWYELQNMLLSLKRLNDLYEAQPEQDPARPAVAVQRLRKQLRLENVSFRYNPNDKDILANITLDVAAGQTVALVGRSGSGKTTLAMLLQRFYAPTEGHVFWDGQDLETVDLKTLREQIGVVAQETTIFTASIRENISLTVPDAPLERIIAAAKLAAAHDFITGFPQGYETMVGEAGIRLSGGQRQRICIARALLKDPSVLIFDEATSALDTESEKAIQQNLKAILHDRTAIIIAHRLSTIQGADVIVVLDEGRVVEMGTHKSLMDKKGLYSYLASQQMGG